MRVFFFQVAVIIEEDASQREKHMSARASSRPVRMQGSTGFEVAVLHTVIIESSVPRLFGR